MSSSQNNIINPKNCSYRCSTRIYWNTSTNEYWEVFTRKKHVCPNRVTNNANKKQITAQSTTTAANPTYYNNYKKKSYYATQSVPKPKMSNSFELLQGSIADIQRKYEILSDIVSEANGKVHGSQSHIVTASNNSISLIVYYEVSEGLRDEVKNKFSEYISAQI
jgi:hypothetical protein